MKDPYLRVVGVHPVDAPEPVWLIEVEIRGTFGDIDWGSITQPDLKKDRSFWQVAYDEQLLQGSGSENSRCVFFFHYLDPNRPLESAHGSLAIPKQTPLPERLRFIRYEMP